MRTTRLALILGICFVSLSWSQVKIGDNPQTLHPASILELEGNSRALVLTRVTDGQMAGITPLNGALVYNTDADCIFYFDGRQWINLCASDNTTNESLELIDTELVLTDSDGNTVSVLLEGAIEQTFTTNPVVNPNETIALTRTDNNFNFEVGQITGENIVDSSINGFSDIQPETITFSELAPESVREEELQDGAVTTAKIENGTITVEDFSDLGATTAGQVLKWNGVNWVPDTDLGSTVENLATDNLTQDLGEDRTYDISGQNLFFTNGSIGIGTLTGTPQSQLDVNGQIQARDGFASTGGTAGNPGYGFFTNGDTNTGMFRIDEDRLGFSTGGAEAMEIDAGQNVGIGIAPAEKLHVNGNILATGTITPDYVFEKYFKGISELNPSYRTLSLEELESFLRKNYHLPGVPSAMEVKKKGGIVINRATEVNLEKIEELFLHTIEQEKKIKALQKENADLTRQLDTLKKDMAEIKALLKKSRSTIE